MGRKEITKNTLIFSGATLVSRILGFVRDILIARYFGASVVTDAFFVAFRIPNLFRRLLGEGALSSSFMPIFAEEERKKGSIKDVLNSATSSLLIVLTLLLLAAELFTPLLVKLVAPGFSKNPHVFSLTVRLTKITFPYIFFMGTAILVGAALNYRGDFFYTSFSPCLLNISLIVAILFFYQKFREPVFCLAWGVFVGGVLQIAFHFLGAFKLDVIPNPLTRPFSPPVLEALKLMAPATIGLAVHQINTLVDTVIASFLPKGSVSFLYYATRLFQLPLALFGIAIGTVLLPYASRYVADGREDEVIENARFSLTFALSLTIPAAIGLVTFSTPIIDVLFRRGVFHTSDSIKTAAALSMYALGLPVISAGKVITSIFHAHKDMKTPVKAAFGALVANIILNIILMKPLKHAGLALATSIASYLQCSYLFFKLKAFWNPKRLLSRTLLKVALLNLAMIPLALALKGFIPYHMGDAFWKRGAHLALYILTFSAIYFPALFLIVPLQKLRTR